MKRETSEYRRRLACIKLGIDPDETHLAEARETGLAIGKAVLAGIAKGATLEDATEAALDKVLGPESGPDAVILRFHNK
jgi:hypothetical protein